ncbi:MAG: hypothetical protein QOC82_387 [Frankiaceae bacterium]|nr:hypothetical protein [Frankiaceae bacterium]
MLPGVASADAGTVSFTTAAEDSQSLAAQFWTPRDHVTLQPWGGGAPDTGVDIEAYQDTMSESFTFVAPDGQALTVGHYPSAVPNGPIRPGDARISVPFCYPVEGSFDVLDIEMTPTGADRVDIVYNVTCNQNTVQGEVAVNEPASVADVLAIPHTIGFAPTYPTKTSGSRPVTYINTGSTVLHPSGAYITGTDAARFHVTSDGCTGKALLPSDSCAVRVAFAPGSGDPATDSASLVVTDDSAEGSQTVALTGTPIPGHTSAYFVGEGDDPVIGPHSFTATAPDGTVNLSGTTDEVVASAPLPINPPGYYRYTVTIHPPTGESLGVGTYSDVAFDPSRGSGAGLQVSGPGYGGTCTNSAVGSFTISQFDVGPSGRVLALSMTWEQHCDGRAAGSYGSFAWRADAAAGPPPTGPGTPSDTFPPGSVWAVVAYGGYATATVGWKKPTDVDLAHIIVRMASGVTPPTTPTSGTGVYSGTGTSVVVSHLTPGRTYSFSIWTEDTNGNLTGPAHEIYHGTRALLTVPKVVPVGIYFRAVGRVVNVDSGAGVSNALMRFYARQPGSTRLTLLGSVRTGNNGVCYLDAKVTGHPYIVAKFLGAPHYGGAAPIAKRPAMALGLTTYYTGHIAPGGTEKVWGTVQPNIAGHAVYLQRHSGGVWVAYKSMVATGTSTFSFAFTLPKGTYTYRVIVPAANGYLSTGTYPFYVPVY